MPDAQIGAVIQLLKDKGMTTNEEFARYVQRDKASYVKEARAARKDEIFVCPRCQADSENWQHELKTQAVRAARGRIDHG